MAGQLVPAGRGLHPARRGAPPPRRSLVDPLEVAPLTFGDPERVRQPDDVVEFIVSDAFLGRSQLYPRQATILKVIFLQEEALTQYDFDVLGEWGDSFRRTSNNGCQPDVLDRMRACRAQGREWFREVVAAIGRRGSKGYIGGLCGARVLWHYMSRPGGPQEYYGIDRDKRLSALVFGGKKEAALANQWRDLANVVLGAPCFTPYVSRPLAQSLTVFAPTDLLRAQERALRGVDSEVDLASFELVPREATTLAGRGPTSFCQFYDEFAHLVATGALRSAEEVWDAATPSLDQFGVDAFIYQGSSTWQMAGQFYENWLRALEVDEAGEPAYPEIAMFQLTSWQPYEDWDRAELLPYRPSTTTTIDARVDLLLPGGQRVPATVPQEVEVPAQTFRALRRAIQTYDDQMRQLEKAKPDTFAVERLSQWAAVLDAYLDQDVIRRAFEPWGGRLLVEQGSGAMDVRYKAHGDPAKVNDRFGFAIGHVEVGPDGLDHVVFDVVHKWEAQDWEDRRIHYVGYDEEDPNVEDDIWAYVRAFMPEEVTFDQFAMPGTLQSLQKRERRGGLPKRVELYEKPANATLNWVRFECMKAALLAGRVHIPTLDQHGGPLEASEIAELELRFLQRSGKRVDHPSAGPVQSKDVADTICEVIWALIGEEMASAIGADLAALGVRPTMQKQTAATARDQDDVSQGLAALTSRGRGVEPNPAYRGPGAGRRRGGWGR